MIRHVRWRADKVKNVAAGPPSVQTEDQPLCRICRQPSGLIRQPGSTPPPGGDTTATTVPLIRAHLRALTVLCAGTTFCIRRDGAPCCRGEVLFLGGAAGPSDLQVTRRRCGRRAGHALATPLLGHRTAPRVEVGHLDAAQTAWSGQRLGLERIARAPARARPDDAAGPVDLAIDSTHQP